MGATGAPISALGVPLSSRQRPEPPKAQEAQHSPTLLSSATPSNAAKAAHAETAPHRAGEGSCSVQCQLRKGEASACTVHPQGTITVSHITISHSRAIATGVPSCQPLQAWKVWFLLVPREDDRRLASVQLAEVPQKEQDRSPSSCSQSQRKGSCSVASFASLEDGLEMEGPWQGAPFCVSNWSK